MTERDTDIEFDFFDEPETREATQEGRRPRRGPRPPMRPPAGVTPLLRLVGLVSFAILIIVLLVFVVQNCRGSQKRDRYESYMEAVAEIAAQSEQLGRQLNSVLTTRGLRPADVEQRLSGLAQSQEQIVGRAQLLDAPGPLRQQQEEVVQTLQLRVSGLRGLADAFGRSTPSTNAGQVGAQLANQGRRLVASDVVWDDFFLEPARSELNRQGVRGVNVPDSNFLPNPDLITSRSMTQIFQRIRGTTTAAGGGACEPRGTGIVSTKVLPSGEELSPDELNQVVASTNLGFAVTIENSGCAQEVRVPVVLTIQKSPEPIVKRAVIDIINPDEQKSVTFRSIGQVPFVGQTSIKVEAQPVPNEENRSNNSAEYPVIFSLE